MSGNGSTHAHWRSQTRTYEEGWDRYFSPWGPEGPLYRVPQGRSLRALDLWTNPEFILESAIKLPVVLFLLCGAPATVIPLICALISASLVGAQLLFEGLTRNLILVIPGAGEQGSTYLLPAWVIASANVGVVLFLDWLLRLQNAVDPLWFLCATTGLCLGFLAPLAYELRSIRRRKAQDYLRAA